MVQIVFFSVTSLKLTHTDFDKGALIDKAGDLDCNFDDVTKCKWKNYPNNTQPDIDDVDYFLFMKTDNKKFPAVIGPNGPARTPLMGKDVWRKDKYKNAYLGEKMILAGAERNKDELKALWYSQAIKCTTRETRLSFTYFIYGSTEVRVITLSKDDHKILWASNPCTRTVPESGVCQATIPITNQNFHVAFASVSSTLNVNFSWEFNR